MIPDGSGAFVKDERGAVVLSKLDDSALQELARNTEWRLPRRQLLAGSGRPCRPRRGRPQG
jgi:hypothetical protein